MESVSISPRTAIWSKSGVGKEGPSARRTLLVDRNLSRARRCADPLEWRGHPERAKHM